MTYFDATVSLQPINVFFVLKKIVSLNILLNLDTLIPCQFTEYAQNDFFIKGFPNFKVNAIGRCKTKFHNVFPVSCLAVLM